MVTFKIRKDVYEVDEAGARKANRIKLEDGRLFLISGWDGDIPNDFFEIKNVQEFEATVRIETPIATRVKQ